jgi:phosphohistidine phosphatase
VQLFLVHHGDAVGPDVDTRRPLSPWGRADVDRIAAAAAARGAKPTVVWHSGKLRAKQTAEAFWRACNALAEFSAWMRDRLVGETRDILIAGHFPYLPRLLSLLVERREGMSVFPLHGVVALESDDAGETWKEMWRLPGVLLK